MNYLKHRFSEAFQRLIPSENKDNRITVGDSVDIGTALNEDSPEEIDSDERRMITSILELDHTSSREIMVPRMDIVALDIDASLAQVADAMWETGHSRIPIFEDSIDNIIGVVHSRDLLNNLKNNNLDTHLADLVRTPLFIPDAKKLDDLLRDFQENHIQIAIVVDEYGGTSGLVTIEDLLEEIVGEIEDEFDVGQPAIEIINEPEAMVDARIPLDDLNEAFYTDFQGDGFAPLGGLLYQQLGKMAVPGDQVHVYGVDIKVITTLGRRIKQVHLTKVSIQN